MANIYTTTNLINDVLLLGHVPLNNDTSASNPYNPDNILRLATLEIQTPIVKQILSTRQGYYLTKIDLPSAADGLYPVPSGAVSGSVANIELVQEPTIIPVNLIVESEQFSTNSPTSTSYGYFFIGNYIKIIPIPNIGITRIWYFGRTSELIQTSQSAQVISSTGFDITVASVPSNLVIGSIVDILGDQPPFNIIYSNAVIVNIFGNVITLDIEPILVSPGDWIALKGFTPIPQIPVEFRVLLAQRVVCKIYESQGYLPKLKVARETLQAYERDTFGLITTRNQAQSKIINPVNGGFLSGNPNRMTNFPAGPGTQ